MFTTFNSLIASSAGLNATDHPLGIACLVIFALSYACVVFEEMLHMKKSKPVMLAAGIIWILVGFIVIAKTSDEAAQPATPIHAQVHNNDEHAELTTSSTSETTKLSGNPQAQNPSKVEANSVSDDAVKSHMDHADEANEATHGKKQLSRLEQIQKEAFHAYNVEIKHLLVEFSELFFFLFVAMTFILTMEERGVFRALRSYLVGKGYTFRQLFWITGIISFFLSPIADNLTTALIMGTVVSRMAAGNKKFLLPAFVNIVVAANSGGAFSPFGDITTLMVWQAGHVSFFDFFQLFIPSVVNFLIPAFILYFFVPKANPEPLKEEVKIYYGAKTVTGIFIGTVVLAITLHNLFHMPPFLGMMTGMSCLMIYNYMIKQVKSNSKEPSLNVFKYIERTEFDTLFFFFGVIFSIGGLAYIGYIDQLAKIMYSAPDKTIPNIIAGLLSAVFDNIPMMFGVLKMNPDMSLYQWLMITMTAGVGGSVLALGSAAGVGLMGISKDYTFMGHLKYSWVVLLGYGASIATHIVLNGPS